MSTPKTFTVMYYHKVDVFNTLNPFTYEFISLDNLVFFDTICVSCISSCIACLNWFTITLKYPLNEPIY